MLILYYFTSLSYNKIFFIKFIYNVTDSKNCLKNLHEISLIFLLIIIKNYRSERNYFTLNLKNKNDLKNYHYKLYFYLVILKGYFFSIF